MSSKVVRVMACLPIERYRKLMNEKASEIQEDDEITDHEEESDTVDPIEMVLMCIGERAQRNARVILHYLANLNTVQFSAVSGEVIVKNETVKGSCFAHLIKLLCTQNIFNMEKPKQFPIGMKMLLKELALSGLPESIIKNSYYSKYLTSYRKKGHYYPDESD